MNYLGSRARPGRAVRYLALLSVLAPSLAYAAVPKITSLSVRGFQSGAATRVIVQGANLLPEPRLLLDVPIASQSVHGVAKANVVEFELTLDKSVVAGVYDLRLSTADGITSPEIVTVDPLPQRPFVATAPVESLPVAIHGSIGGSTVQETKFTGHKGEQVTVDVLARRFGSKLRPVVHLYDSQRRQVAWSLPVALLAGDVRIKAQLPADDTYTVAVHDLAYAAGAPGYYRLAIGEFDYVDQVYPPVVSRASSAALEWVGKSGAQLTGKYDATATAAALQGGQGTNDAALGDCRPLAWPSCAAPVGLRPHVQLSDLAELAEGYTLDASRQLPAIPVAVSGCLALAGEEDVYHVDVAEGDKLRFEVFADRLGSPIDATLELRNPEGVRLAQMDDAVGTGADPRLDYTVVKGVTRLSIVVADAYRHGGANCIYRLVATRPDDVQATADFRLRVFEDTHQIVVQGSKVFRVEAERFNYDGPILLSVEGLPCGFASPAVEIPARAGGAPVEIRRPGESCESDDEPSFKRIVIRGRASGLQPAIVRVAEMANHPIGDLQPWLKYDLVAGPTSVPQSFAVAWGDEPPADPSWYVGIDGKVVVRFQRGPGAIGPLRLSLVTSQTPVSVNGQPQLVQMIRGSTATIDIPVDNNARAASVVLATAEKTVADLEKTRPATGDPDPKLLEQIAAAVVKRDEAAGKMREAESKIAGTSEVKVLVPVDLRTTGYDLSVRAELRSMDNLSVVAEAFTPPRRFNVQLPVELVAAAKEDEPITLDPKTGATVTLDGTIKRLGGFAGDVTLTLVGLPAGIVVPRVVLKPADQKYQLQFKLPPTFAAERIEAVQLSATFASEAARANITAKIDQPVPTIRLQKPLAPAPQPAPQPPAAAEKPPAAK